MGPSAIREICTIIFIDFDGLFKKYEEIRIDIGKIQIKNIRSMIISETECHLEF